MTTTSQSLNQQDNIPTLMSKHIKVIYYSKNNDIESKDGELVNSTKDTISLLTNDRTTDIIQTKSIIKIHEQNQSNDNTVASSLNTHVNYLKIDTELKEVTKFNKTLDETKHKIKQNIESIENDRDLFKDRSKEKILYCLDEIEETDWNQFETNNQLFKVKSNYNENLYNAEIKEDEIPEHIRLEAEKIEKELKATKSNSNHINEERGIISENEENEEKYSSVIRQIEKKVIKAKSSGSKTWKVILFIIVIIIIFISYRVYKVNRKLNKNKFKKS